MKPVPIVRGDLLASQEDYIVHQCNGLTTYASGLAKQIFARYPWANCYRDGSKRVAGEIDIRNGPDEGQGVINLFGQHRPGRANSLETADQREAWFRNCLAEIGKHFSNKKAALAFPFQIGCGMAGGKWEHYYQMINEFQHQNPNLELAIYQI
jgi:O-acetyl-ADP-ribose deacetylase (regulator of RNase III)